jgi:hypothetical protein
MKQLVRRGQHVPAGTYDEAVSAGRLPAERPFVTPRLPGRLPACPLVCLVPPHAWRMRFQLILDVGPRLSIDDIPC